MNGFQELLMVKVFLDVQEGNFEVRLTETAEEMNI